MHFKALESSEDLRTNPQTLFRRKTPKLSLSKSKTRLYTVITVHTGDQLNPVPSERCFFCGHNHMGIESPKPTSTRIQAMVPPSQDLNPKGSTNRNNHFQTVLSSQLPKRPRVMPPCTAHCRDHRPFNLGFLRAHQNK